jgi:hypothetical protein
MINGFNNQLALDSVFIRDKGLRLSNTSSELEGTLRLNTTIKRFEGYTGENDPTGKSWHTLNREMASASVLGDIKTGDNLDIETDGIMSATQEGVSRFYQRVITVAKSSGKGDYNNITDAISFLNDLTSQNFDSKPSNTNPYIILVTSGIYTENITIPSYVTIKGDDNTTSIIQGTIAHNNINLAGVINMGNHSGILDITIRHSSVGSEFTGNDNVVGIYTNAKNNILIRNVRIEMSYTDTHNYGVYIKSSSLITLSDTDIYITSGNLSNYGIYNYLSDSDIDNCNIVVSGVSTDGNYGIYNNTCQRPIINNCRIDVSGSSEFNIGVKNIDSSPQYRNTYINATSNSDGSVVAYGIDNDSSTEILVTLTSGLISFVHNENENENERDFIQLSGGGFESQGFLKDFMIQVSGSSQAQNNQIFMISQIEDDKLILGENQNLVTSSTGDSITINQLYTQIVDECQITGYTHSINHSTSNIYYASKLGNSVLYGGEINPNNNFIYFRDLETIIVSPSDGDYNSIYDALLSISDNSEFKHYLIKVKTGIYNEVNQIRMKPYVSLVGSGVENTTVNFNIASNTESYYSAAIELSSNSSIASMTVRNIVTGDYSYAEVIYGEDITNCAVHDINLFISGSSTSLTGFKIINSSINLIDCSVEVDTDTGNDNGYGIDLNNSTTQLKHLTLSVNGSSSIENIAIKSFKTNLSVYSTNISVNGCSGINAGIYTTRTLSISETTDVDTLTVIDKCNIVVEDNTAYSIYADENCLCIAHNCRLTGERHNHSTERQLLKILGCYEVIETTPMIYRSINIFGVSSNSSDNTSLVGDNVGNPDITGVNDTAIGYGSALSLTSGSDNTFVGQMSGTATTIGSNLSFMGAQSGYTNQTGNNNTFYGNMAGYANTSGHHLTRIGYKSGYDQGSISDNITLGSEAGYNNYTSTDLIFIGQKVGYYNEASDLVFIGGGTDADATGYRNITGNKNIYLGSKVNPSGAFSEESVCIGYQVCYNNSSSGLKNTFTGYQSGYSNQFGSQNVFLGMKSGYSSVTANNNTLIGYQTGEHIQYGHNNTLLGTNVGNSNMTYSERCIFIGAPYDTEITSTGFAVTNGIDNILLGCGSGYNITDGTDNIICGANSGISMSGNLFAPENRNILLGASVANNYTGRSDLVALGFSSAGQTAYGEQVIIGSYAGSDYTGSKSVLIGYEAGKYLTGTGLLLDILSESVYIGYQSGMSVNSPDEKGFKNVFIGNLSGINIQTGHENVLVGYEVGNQLVEGNNNIMMGYQSGYNSESLNNIFIGSYSGYSAVGNMDNITPEGQSNIYIGHESGYSNVSGNYNIFVGQESGYTSTSIGYELYIGYRSGYLSETSNDSIGIGSYANYHNFNGWYSIAIGHKAGYRNSGQNNILMGYASGYGISESVYNIVIGFKAAAGGDDPDAETPSITDITGNDNIIIGDSAGYNLSSATSNLFLGYQSGYNTTTGDKNIFIGDNTGYSNTSGEYNIFIGSSDGDTGSGAGFNNISGDTNSFIGFEAGLNNTTGDNNIFFGSRAGYNNISGVRCIAFGNFAGYGNTSGNDNICYGPEAGYNLATGSYNIALGYQAGYSQTDSNVEESIYLGYRAGYNNNVNRSIMIGYLAGYLNTTGTQNINIGTRSGYSNITANNNILIGANAGFNNLESDSIMIGVNAGLGNTTGSGNLYIGNNTSRINTTGSNNLAIGSQAGYNNVTSNNLFIGSSAGYSNTSGTDNIFIGTSSGYENTDGNGNVFIGSLAGQLSNSGDNNLYIGPSAGYSHGGNGNIAIGRASGAGNGTGSGNMFIGSGAGSDISSGQYNVAIGYASGYNLNLGSGNFFLGVESGSRVTTGSNNVYAGLYAGSRNVTGDFNVYFGYYAGYSANSADNNSNIAIGFESGYSMSTGEFNTFIGNYAGKFNTTGSKNIGLGDSASLNITTGDNNVCIGNYSGETINTGYSNLLVGYRTGRSLTTGDNNLAIGNEAGLLMDTATKNILIGASAGSALTGGDGNICIGSQSGIAITDGINNITIGYLAGSQLTSGSNSIIIGYAAGTLTENETDLVFIGKTAGQFSVGSGNMFIGGSSGINNSGSNNMCIGSGSGTSLTSSHNISIGLDSGTNTTNGEYNTYIGNAAGFSNVEGSYNVYLGTSAGDRALSTENIAIGYFAGYGITDQSRNTYIGYLSGYADDWSSSGMYIGGESGRSAGGSAMVCIGYKAGIYGGRLSNGSAIIGNETLPNAFAPVFSTHIGYNVTNEGFGGDGNNIIGSSIGRQIGRGTYRLYLGSGISPIVAVTTSTTSFTGSIDPPLPSAIITFILPGVTGTTTSELRVGVIRSDNPDITTFMVIDLEITSVDTFTATIYADTAIASGGETIIGSNLSEMYIIGGRHGNIGANDFSYAAANSIIGSDSANNLTIGSKNVAIGDNCFNACQNGKYNSIIGYGAGNSIEGHSNVCIGVQSGYNLGIIDANTMIGFRAGYHSTSISTSNVYIGYQAGQSHSGLQNILIGHETTVTEFPAVTTTANGLFAIYSSDIGITDEDVLIAGDILTKYVSLGTITPSCKFDINSATTSYPQMQVSYDTDYYLSYVANASGKVITTGINNTANTIMTYGANGIMGINTDTPTGATPIVTDTIFQVNGAAIATSWSTFTGCHYINIAQEPTNPEFGMILSSVGKVNKDNRINTIVTVKLSNMENDRKVYGVYYKKINNTSDEHMICSVGEGTILVTNINGNIESGDYITSSTISGYGMKQSDDLLHTYTVAKATENINWNAINETINHSGIIYKKALIGCTYHCG